MPFQYQRLQLVTLQVYNILGGIVAMDSDMGPEMTNGVNEASRSSGPLRKTVLKKAKCAMQAKLTFADSMATTSLLRNAAT